MPRSTISSSPAGSFAAPTPAPPLRSRAGPHPASRAGASRAFRTARGPRPVGQEGVTRGGGAAPAGALRATLGGRGRSLPPALEPPARGSDTPGASAATADVPATRETELVAFALEIRQP